MFMKKFYLFIGFTPEVLLQDYNNISLLQNLVKTVNCLCILLIIC